MKKKRKKEKKKEKRSKELKGRKTNEICRTYIGNVGVAIIYVEWLLLVNHSSTLQLVFPCHPPYRVSVEKSKSKPWRIFHNFLVICSDYDPPI